MQAPLRAQERGAAAANEGVVRPQRRIRFAVAAACAAMLASAAPAAPAIGPDGPCRIESCTAKLLVDAERAKWRSTETFYPQNEEIRTLLRVRGRKLRFDVSFGPGGCRSRYLGSGLMVVVKVCGDATPVRIRAERFKGRRGNLSISYRAAPAIRGDG